MKHTLIISIVIIALTMLWFISPIPPDWPVTIHAQGSIYPAGFELSCPAGFQPLSQLVTYNPNTQRFRANVCVDSSGTLNSPGIAASPAGVNTAVQINNNGSFGSITGFTATVSSLIYNPPGQQPVFSVGGGGTGAATAINLGGAGAIAVLKSGGSLGGTLVVVGGGVQPGTSTVASLPTASTNTGSMFQVSDSTAVATEGQTCVGSSTNVALAFSNGSVWKCF